MDKEKWKDLVQMYQSHEDERIKDMAGALAISELSELATMIESAESAWCQE